jgi:hypothetical protein
LLSFIKKILKSQGTIGTFIESYLNKCNILVV